MLRALFATVLLVIVAPAAFPQKSPGPTKEELIGEFATLTNANQIHINVELSMDDVSETMNSLIDDDKDLNSVQKDELKKAAGQIVSQLAQDTQKRLAESKILNKLGEQVVADVYRKAFTEAELVELIAFFKTPLGQRAVNFLASSKSQIEQDFRAAMLEKIREVSQPAIDTSMAQLRQRIQNAKKK